MNKNYFKCHPLIYTLIPYQKIIYYDMLGIYNRSTLQIIQYLNYLKYKNKYDK